MSNRHFKIPLTLTIFTPIGKGNIIEVNKAACNSLGYAGNELLNMNISEIKTSKNASVIQKLQSYILSIARNISERKKVERRVLNAVIQTEERERERFAKDMHDGLGPLLSVIKLYVNELTDGGLEKDEKKEMVKYVDELIDEAILNTRTISNNLMPRIINDYGVAKAIQSFCDKINKTEKINIHFRSTNIDNTLDQNVQLILYRAVSELINNTLKHAFAKNIYIDLNKEGNKISLTFSDDGKGFEVDNIMKNKCLGMGLRNVISRIKSINGNCKFFSSPGTGFKITIEIDL